MNKIMSMKSVVFLAALFLSLNLNSTNYANAAPRIKGKVCLTAVGAIFVRAKCKKTETTLTNKYLMSSGAQGIQGPAGADGAPAKSVSAFSSYTPTGVFKSLPADNSKGVVLDLNTDDHSGPIVVSFSARLLVNVTVKLSNGDNSFGRTFRCQATFNPGEPDETILGLQTFDNIAIYDTKTISFTNTIDVAPGVYNVNVACSTGQSNPYGEFLGGTLVVTAVSL